MKKNFCDEVRTDGQTDRRVGRNSDVDSSREHCAQCTKHADYIKYFELKRFNVSFFLLFCLKFVVMVTNSQSECCKSLDIFMCIENVPSCK